MAQAVPLACALACACSVYQVLAVLFGAQDSSFELRLGGASQRASLRERLAAVFRNAGAVVPKCVRDAGAVKRCREEFARSPLYGRAARLLLGRCVCAEAREGADGAPPVACGQDEVECRMGMLLVFLAVSGCVGIVVVGGMLGIVPGACLPVAYFMLKATKRSHEERRRIVAAMPEAFASLAVALGSGHTLTQGMRFVGSHAEEPVRSEFLRVACAVECGVPVSDVLDELLERMPAPGLGLVSLALKISQRTGAPLRELLGEAADMVSERIRLERQLDVKTSQARMSARLVAWMPVGMVGALTLVLPDFREGIATPLGAGSVSVALALDACAWAIIRRIMKVDVE